MLYLEQSGVFGALQAEGKEPWIHTPVTVSDLDDTLNGLRSLGEAFGHQARLVVWLNERDGLVEAGGKPFAQMKAAQELSADIRAIARIPRIDDLHAEDFARVLRARKTLAEAVKDPSLMLMERQRLRNVQRRLTEELAKALGPLEGAPVAEALGVHA